MKEICPQCGEKMRLGTHWAVGSCDYPEYSEKQLDIVKGLLMGDGYIRNKDGAKNPYFVVSVINRHFLEWLDNIFGVLTNGVSLKSTPKQISERAERSGFGNGEDGDYNTMYQLRFRSHPRFKDYLSWYSDGSKSFPTNLTLTKDLVKMWYVCDGGLNHGGYPKASLYTVNEQDQLAWWAEKIRKLGFDCYPASEQLIIPCGDVSDFLDWIGPAPPGYEYKWEIDSRERYNKLKNRVYTA